MSQSEALAFMKQKMTNFRSWLEEHGACITHIPTPSNIQLILIASTLADHFSQAIEKRDFEALTGEAIEDLTGVIELVKERPEMHDKFWRYLELFSKCVSE